MNKLSKFWVFIIVATLVGLFSKFYDYNLIQSYCAGFITGIIVYEVA